MSASRSEWAPRAFSRDESGAAIVEYGIAIALILALVLGTLIGVGESLATLFGAVESNLAAEAPD